MKVEVDRIPKPCDVVTQVMYANGGWQVNFEPHRSFYARNLIANSWWLIGRGLRLAYVDLKHLILGQPGRPSYETLAEAERR